MKKSILPVLIALLGTFTAFSQTNCIKGNVYYEIVSESNGTLVFDLFIGLDADNTCGPIKLGTSDFVLDYKAAAFTNPVLTKISNPDAELGLDVGFCGLKPSSTSNTAAAKVVQANYHSSLSETVKNNQLLINLNAITPSNQNELKRVIANVESPSRLGRFSINGYSGKAHGLDFAIEGEGFNTKIFSFGQEAPFPLYAIALKKGENGNLTIEDALQEGSLQLNPNPAQNSITLAVRNITDLANVNYQISNLQGQLLKEGRLTGENMSINLGLEAGVYFVRLIKAGTDVIQPQKLIITK